MLKVFNMSSGAAVEDELNTCCMAKPESLPDLPYPSLQLVLPTSVPQVKRVLPFVIVEDDPEETATPLIH